MMIHSTRHTALRLLSLSYVPRRISRCQPLALDPRVCGISLLHNYQEVCFPSQTGYYSAVVSQAGALTLQIDEVAFELEGVTRLPMSKRARVVSPSERREMRPVSSPAHSTVQGLAALLGSDQGPPVCLRTLAAAFKTPRSAQNSSCC